MSYRIVWPGVLAIIGTVSPIALVVRLITLPPLSSSGSEGSPYIVVFFVAALALVSFVWLLAFSIVLTVETSHHMLWGFIVAASYGLTFLPLYGISYYILAGSPVGSPAWFLALPGTAGPILGLVGGVWGIFWKTKWTPLKLARVLVGLAGRVMVGGVVSFFCWLVIPYQPSIILLLPPLLFGVLAVIMYKRAAGLRGLGIAVLVVSGFQILYLYSFLVQLFSSGYGVDYAVRQLPPYIAAGVGIGLGVSGAIAAIRRGKNQLALKMPDV